MPSFVKTSPHSLFKPNRVTSLLAVSIRFRPIKLDFPARYVGCVELTALSGVLGNTTVPDQGSHAVCPDPPAPASPPLHLEGAASFSSVLPSLHPGFSSLKFV